ncbi:MAG: acylphosphatase [Verrucomicrobiota bacterium]
MTVFYSGRVHGVGFRATARYIACGFDVTARCATFPTAASSLIAEGTKAEIKAFLGAIATSELSGFIARQVEDVVRRPRATCAGS